VTPRISFRNTSSRVDGKDYLVKLDFLHKKGAENAQTRALDIITKSKKDLYAVLYFGINIACEFNSEKELKGLLPSDSKAETSISD